MFPIRDADEILSGVYQVGEASSVALWILRTLLRLNNVVNFVAGRGWSDGGALQFCQRSWLVKVGKNLRRVVGESSGNFDCRQHHLDSRVQLVGHTQDQQRAAEPCCQFSENRVTCRVVDGCVAGISGGDGMSPASDAEGVSTLSWDDGWLSVGGASGSSSPRSAVPRVAGLSLTLGGCAGGAASEDGASGQVNFIGGSPAG